MSDVNQAFLRAYVKSRAAAGSQPLRTPQSDVQRRVDPAVGQVTTPRSAPTTEPAETSPPIPTAPIRTGVWSALGVERGVKGAVVSQPPPAVVRNAATAVPLEATQVRAKSPVLPAMDAEPKSPSLEALNHAWSKKRAPALPGWNPHERTQIPPATAPTLPDRADASLSPAAPVQGANPKIQTRTDAPSARGMAGPHSSPASQRAIDRESLNKLPLPVAFVPGWEVDNFLWPEVVVRLEQSVPASFRQIGHHLANANQSGLKVLAVTSGERGVGRSTVAMHLARAAAGAGLKVAIVDTDAANPSLIDQLRLDVQHGWQDCLFEAVPLEEVAIHAVSDSITLFPLTEVVSPQQVHANLHRMSKLIRRISNAFDLVILDSSRLHLDQREIIGVSNERVVDAAIVVVDTELSIKDKIDSAISILQSLGLSSIGLVENFRS
jgi:Mrp family chromosome partitioning ATPase